MKLNEIIELLNAEVHYMQDEHLKTDIKTAAASDLMSEILACVDVPDVLLTGLTNTQVIRTSSIFGIKAIVIVRGRLTDSKVIELAKEEDIPIMTTQDTLFTSSGKLYGKGITGVRTAPSK